MFWSSSKPHRAGWTTNRSSLCSFHLQLTGCNDFQSFEARNRAPRHAFELISFSRDFALQIDQFLTGNSRNAFRQESCRRLKVRMVISEDFTPAYQFRNGSTKVSMITDGELCVVVSFGGFMKARAVSTNSSLSPISLPAIRARLSGFL